MRVTLLDTTRLRLALCPTGGFPIRISLCNLCVLCVSVVEKFLAKKSPQRHRERRGCTEKKLKLKHYCSTLCLACILLVPFVSQAANPISLDGYWRFAM